MRPESLRLLLQAARINPAASVSGVAKDNTRTSEALIDVHAHVSTGGASTWSDESWDSLLEEIDNDPRTLAQFVDTPEVRALIRAQEVARAT